MKIKVHAMKCMQNTCNKSCEIFHTLMQFVCSLPLHFSMSFRRQSSVKAFLMRLMFMRSVKIVIRIIFILSEVFIWGPDFSLDQVQKIFMLFQGYRKTDLGQWQPQRNREMGWAALRGTGSLARNTEWTRFVETIRKSPRALIRLYALGEEKKG